MENSILLFYAPAMEQLARRIAALRPGQIELGSIVWGRFEKGLPNFFIKDAGDIQGWKIVFLASMSTTAEMFEEVMVLREIRNLAAGSLHVVVPFFATATMERAKREGEVVTASAQTHLFSLIGLTHTGGPVFVTVFEPHTLSLREFFPPNVVVSFKSALGLLGDRLSQFPSDEGFAEVFPDKGAQDRFGEVVKNPRRRLHTFPQIVCGKRRLSVTERQVEILEGNPEGMHCVIIDDLGRGGGTIIECGRALFKAGARKVSAFVTHGVFPDRAWERLVESIYTMPDGTKVGFSYIWTTDSCPETAAQLLDYDPPFQVLSLDRRIADLLIPTI